MAGLERAARKEAGLGSIGRETVRRMLKKRLKALAQYASRSGSYLVGQG
jgi:hypothetical protein